MLVRAVPQSGSGSINLLWSFGSGGNHLTSKICVRCSVMWPSIGCGGCRAGARVDCFPTHAAFPKWQEGRHPHWSLSRPAQLHSRYGPPDRSAALGRPLSRGSSPCGCPPEPLVGYRVNRQLSGWNLPPLDNTRLRGAPKRTQFPAGCDEGGVLFASLFELTAPILLRVADHQFEHLASGVHETG